MTKWGAAFIAALGGLSLTGVTARGQEKAMEERSAPPAVYRNLDTHHLFTPPTDLQSWQVRRRALRLQILMSAGLWPMPLKTPLRPRITGRIEHGDFTVENVALETLPGFYLCGNLYRPKGKHGPFPGIANPHGHWEQGRLAMQPDVPKAEPAPAPMGEGRGNLVAIGVNLARQGYVVFAYDMVGYNDTNQVNHSFANGLQPWLWDVSLMGLQLWNSIRVVDYLQSRPDVDRKRIGVTGASGGGTQTFLLGAVDDRVACSVPVNMVSASMQGGCLCENGPGLRVGTDNVEIAALVAPAPQLLVAATGDWTKNVPKEEWPALKKVYDLYGAGGRTACVQFNYAHNYNIESREAMYAWFGRWLLHDPNPRHFLERPFEIDTSRMRVWTDKEPMPTDALKEPELILALVERSRKQLAALWPRDAAGLKRFAETARPALSQALCVDLGDEPGVNASQRPATARDRRTANREAAERATLIVATSSDEPTARSLSRTLAPNGRVVKVLVVDPIEAAPDRLWNAFYTCYNRTPLGDRVQAIAAALRTLQRRAGARVDTVGLGPTGLWTLLARGIAGGVGRTVVDTGAFASDEDDAYVRALYAPGLRRAGGVQAAAVLCAPGPLCLFNTGDAFKTDAIASAYQALHAPLTSEPGPMTDAQIASWLEKR